MNGAEALVEGLIQYGTDVVLGLPGDTSVGLSDALRAGSKRITHVMARDERSAAFMADVYARLSGRPGVCEGPTGGGRDVPAARDRGSAWLGGGTDRSDNRQRDQL